MVIGRLRGEPLDPHAAARELDLIAEAVVERLGGGSSVWELIDAINHELFDECGYRGNIQEYGDPENSYLDRVIARRTGIPISLSLGNPGSGAASGAARGRGRISGTLPRALRPAGRCDSH